MQKDGSNNDLDPEGENGSVTPLGDDSVESLTATTSPGLYKDPKTKEDADISHNSEADLDALETSFDEEDLEDDDLENVRVANMHDDLDAIEMEPLFHGEYDENEYDENDLKYVPVRSADELGRDEFMFGILRRYSTVVQDNRAGRIRTRYLLIVIAALILLLITLGYAFTLYPKTVYIPTKDNAAICEVTPENNPYLTDLSISEFGRDGILSLYSINFTNWQEQTDRVFDEYFTSDGKIRTIQALKESGLIAYVDNNALSLRANSTQTSHVESKGFFPNGTPYWTVSFPFVVEVYSGREKEPIQIRQYVATARVVVDRASAHNPKGLGIDAVTLFEPKR